MEKFIKYFWIDFGDPAKDIYVELSSEEGKQGVKTKRYTISFESDSPSGLAAYLKLPQAPNDGIVRTHFGSLEEAENFFDSLYKKSSNRSDMVVG
jgi:hypothetical protein